MSALLQIVGLRPAIYYIDIRNHPLDCHTFTVKRVKKSVFNN